MCAGSSKGGPHKALCIYIMSILVQPTAVYMYLQSVGPGAHKRNTLLVGWRSWHNQSIVWVCCSIKSIYIIYGKVKTCWLASHTFRESHLFCFVLMLGCMTYCMCGWQTIITIHTQQLQPCILLWHVGSVKAMCSSALYMLWQERIKGRSVQVT